MATCEVAYLVQGQRQAEPLLLSASLGTTYSIWDPQAKRLAERSCLIRYDHRGHGKSAGPPGPYRLEDLALDALALLDRLEIEQVTFCGISLGGMVGMWLAANEPARLRRLVVLCSSAYMPPADAWAQRARIVREAVSTEPIADDVVGRWLTPAFARANPDVVRTLRDMLISISAREYALCCEAIEHMDLRHRLDAIRAPTLVIGGELDRAAPPAQHARVIADGVPGARLELVPAAHLANVELPEAIADLIVDHLHREDPQ